MVVPDRLGVEQVAERGEVAAGERSEDGPDDIDVGDGGCGVPVLAVPVLAVMDGSFAESLVIACQEP